MSGSPQRVLSLQTIIFRCFGHARFLKVCISRMAQSLLCSSYAALELCIKVPHDDCTTLGKTLNRSEGFPEQDTWFLRTMAWGTRRVLFVKHTLLALASVSLMRNGCRNNVASAVFGSRIGRCSSRLWTARSRSTSAHLPALIGRRACQICPAP